MTSSPVISLTHATPLVSFTLTWVTLWVLLRMWSHRILDYPNERSLHHRPVPRLGGVAVAFGIATGVPFVSQTEWWPLWFGALLLVGISFVDDMIGLPILARLVAHFVTAVGFVFLVLTSRTDGWSILTIVALVQAIIDERADERQRRALIAVLHGEETEEAKTHWWVFHAMSSTVLAPLFKPIDCEVDIERRTARVAIPGVLAASGRPIISPATGEEHRVRIDIPAGIEFEIAEIGSASTTATGPIELTLDDSYGQFNRLHHTGTGVIRSRA